MSVECKLDSLATCTINEDSSIILAPGSHSFTSAKSVVQEKIAYPQWIVETSNQSHHFYDHNPKSPLLLGRLHQAIVLQGLKACLPQQLDSLQPAIWPQVKQTVACRAKNQAYLILRNSAFASCIDLADRRSTCSTK